jgi:methionine sulfoxide reductase heme-binding subunit
MTSSTPHSDSPDFRSRPDGHDCFPGIRPEGEDWGLVLVATLANAAVAALVLSGWGTGPEGTELALRVTARVSFVWFLLAFVASPLQRLAPGAAGAFLLRHRRAFGIIFGLSMSMHVGFILRLFVLFSPERPPMVTWADFVIGIPGLLLVAAMTVTSLQALKRVLGPARWRKLHRTGVHVVWAIFFLCLVDSVGRKQTQHPFLAYHVFIAALVAAMALRLAAARKVARGR